MESHPNDRFEVLHHLAVGAAGGQDLRQLAGLCLSQASQIAGLAGAALYLFDEDFEVTLSVIHAESDGAREMMLSLEQDLYQGLRKSHRLISAYVTLDESPPLHSFTMPLRYKARTLGAVTGVQRGRRTLISEDLFLETLSALLTLHIAASQVDSTATEIDAKAIAKERLAAVLETAVTLNHEINNPLTAILGNVQLLLLKREDLDDDVKKKLQTIEESASRIQTVVKRLLDLDAARSVEYNDGIQMIDLSEKQDEDQEDGQPE